jgi:hypothetical protein
VTLFERIRKEIPDGLVLKTLVVGNRFKVKSVESERLVFFVGTKTDIAVSKACWNGIPNFLKGKGWVKIGAKHEVTVNVYNFTLEKYLRECTSSKSRPSQGIYVASLLEYLKVAEVDHNRPSKLRLL